MKQISVLVFFAILAISGLRTVHGAGECGKSSTPDREAFKLAPCMSAAQDETVSVSSNCCAQVKRIGQNPSCLCAAMLSNTAKMAGIKLDVAVTIPKRCNLSDRPIGYKCGGQFCLLSLTAVELLFGNLYLQMHPALDVTML